MTEARRAKLAEATAAAVAFFIVGANLGAGQNQDETKVNDFCTERWYLQKMEATLQQRIEVAAQATKTATANANLFRLAATIHSSDNKATGYAALAVGAEQKAATTATQAYAFIQAQDSAKALLAKKMGETALNAAPSNTEAIPLAGTGSVAATGGRTVHGQATDKHCATTQPITLANKLTCSDSNNRKSATESQAAFTAAGNRLLARPATELLSLTASGVILAKGTPPCFSASEVATTDAPGCGTTAGDNTLQSGTNVIAAATRSFKKTRHNTHIEIKAKQAQGTPSTVEDANSVPLLTDDAELADKIREAFSMTPPAAPQASALTTAAVLADGPTAEFAKAIKKQQGSTSAASLNSEEIAELVFGDKKVDIQEAYIKPLTSDGHITRGPDR
uniref:Variant surface glycoprotein 1125.2667 n=1 Tax=Trypanosoma brucei TaxID=5691 RepID=A0A1J0R8A0_9TRYP|nr:variant surface glycoprotein 1125.2667 [Trypanosoma brucei]